MARYVYLAGAILGCDEAEAHDWRRAVDGMLGGHGIVAVSPLRCEPLIGGRYLPDYADNLFGTSRAITSKNVFDVRNCDMTLAYLPRPAEGRRQSWGTMCEMAWARMLDRPVILVTDDPDVREHPVLNACANWVLGSLEEAVEVIVGVLGGYTGGKNV